MKTYLVGGAVRDKLMGIEPKDRDYVVVGATPEQLLAQGFSQVGADFPVFLHPVTGEEHALARTERKNGVGYHGFDVTFDKSVTLRDDLERRDLTINSMAMDDDGTIIDYFGGLKDLDNQLLRHTSAAFGDDPLRVIRLARFFARMPQFTIHHATFALARRMVENGELNHLPAERFAAEIVKVLESNKPADVFFTLLSSMGVEKHVYFFQFMNMQRLADVALKVQQDFAPEHRAEAFAALAFGGDVFTIKIGGSEAQTLRNLLIQNKRQTDALTKAERLVKLCHRIGFQAQRRCSRFVKLMQVAQAMGVVFEFDPAQVNRAHALLAPVSTNLGAGLLAQGKSGREIGDEIAAERLRVAEALVGQPT